MMEGMLSCLFQQKLYTQRVQAASWMDLFSYVHCPPTNEEDTVLLKRIHQALYNEMVYALSLPSVRYIALSVPVARPRLWEPYKLLRLCGFSKDVAWYILEYAEFITKPSTNSMMEASGTVLRSCNRLKTSLSKRERSEEDFLWDNPLSERILEVAKKREKIDFTF
jgi:hypothetical protein